MGCSQSSQKDLAKAPSLPPEAMGPARTLLTSASQEKLPTEDHKKALDRALLQQRLQIWVLRGELVRSFETFGKMDPFVVVEHLPKSGPAWEFARTRTDWGGHMKPSFNYLCRSIEVDGEDVIRFKILEKNFGELGTPTFCGEASASVRTMLGSNVLVSAQHTEPLKLKLTRNGEETGFLVLQAGLQEAADQENFTLVSAKKFESPAQIMEGRSTAFTLTLKEAPLGTSKQAWIGKDLSRAHPELAFYEEVRKLRTQDTPFKHLLEYMLKYEGVVQLHAEGQKPNEPPKQLLVLENPGVREVCGSTFRRVDLKIGSTPVSAAGGSRLQALKQSLCEAAGQSASGPGYHLERFQNQPASLQSAEAVLELSGTFAGKAMCGKVRKAMLQRMPATDVLMYFMDLQLQDSPGESAIMQEKLLSQMAGKLAGLAVACRRAPAPQVWNGTSLALTIDTGAGVAPTEATVKLFGWGQASLTSQEQHQALAPAERRDRAAKWREFTSSIDKVAWEVSRAYLHRFGNAQGWREVKFVVADFDAISSHDFIGQASLHLDESQAFMGEQILQLVDKKGDNVIGKNGLPASLTCSVQFINLKKGPLRGIWRVSIAGAANLPSRDSISGSSDPWVSLYASGFEGSGFCFQQRSSVAHRDLNPQWNEHFDLPLAGPDELLGEALDEFAPGLGSEVIKSGDKLLPCGVGSGFVPAVSTAKDEKAAVALWSTTMAYAADRIARGVSIPRKADIGGVHGELLVEPVITAASRLKQAVEAWSPSAWSWWGTCG